MSAQNSAGIQTLLDAEREAQKIVQKAREYPMYLDLTPFENVFNEEKLQNTDRTKRVKDARSEAQKEIDDYRKQKEQEFQKFETEHSSGNKKAEEDANKDAEKKLADIKSAGQKSGDRVVQDLLKIVVNVQPEVPDKVQASES